MGEYGDWIIFWILRYLCNFVYFLDFRALLKLVNLRDLGDFDMADICKMEVNWKIVDVRKIWDVKEIFYISEHGIFLKSYFFSFSSFI